MLFRSILPADPEEVVPEAVVRPAVQRVVAQAPVASQSMVVPADPPVAAQVALR